MKFGSGVTLPVGYLAPPLLAVAFNAASAHFGGGHFNVPQILGNAVIGMGAAFAAHNLADRLLRRQHAGITRGFKTISRVQASIYALTLLFGSSVFKIPDIRVDSGPNRVGIHFSHRGEIFERSRALDIPTVKR